MFTVPARCSYNDTFICIGFLSHDKYMKVIIVQYLDHYSYMHIWHILKMCLDITENQFW